MRIYKSDPEYHYTVFGNSVQIKEQCKYWKTREHKQRLEAACNEAYQVVGLMLLEGHDAPRYTSKDVTRMLDNLLAAVNNRPLPNSDLLPCPKKL